MAENLAEEVDECLPDGGHHVLITHIIGTAFCVLYMDCGGLHSAMRNKIQSYLHLLSDLTKCLL